LKAAPASPRPAWLHILAGLCASLIGIGLARFAYTPLLPLLIEAHWFSASDAVYLGAANLAGYLIGAIIGRPIAARTTNVHALRAMSLLATATFFACAFPLSVGWFFVWRLLSGIAGGAIMVLVTATVLPHIPEHRKGIASGAVFVGVGLGIAASGTVVPLLLGFGLRETWIGLAVLSLILTAVSWTAWPTGAPAAKPAVPASSAADSGRSINIIYTEYALMAFGLVPAMVFLVDFIARGLGAGAHLGSLIWILYGLGAILGPPVYGFVADRLGARIATRIFLLVQTIAVGLLALVADHWIIGFLTVVIGSFPPGIVPLVLAWIRERLPGDMPRQNVIWSRATIVFAAFQALGGYAYSAIFNASGGNHRMLFAIGAVVTMLALAVDLAVPLRRKKNKA
jgi:predicted MFS family arabinose efflux permease